MTAVAYVLEVTAGPRTGTRFRLPAGSVLLGSDPACGLAFPGVPELAQRHARLEAVAGGVHVADLGSPGGIVVNDSPVRAGLLRPGDRLAVGPLRLRLDGADTAGEAGTAPQRSDAVSSKRTSTTTLRRGTRSVPRTPASAPAAEAHASGEAKGGASARGAGGASRRALLRLGGVLLLACLLAWVAFRLVRAGSGAEDGSARILRIREERVFASVRPFERLRVVPVEPSGVTAVGAERYDGPLAGVCAAASGRLRAAGRPGFDFVVLRGRARGEAEVHCRDASGRTVRRVLAVVRGVRRPEWPRELDRAAGRALAEERLRDGRRLAADGRLHGAIARYDEALALFRTHGADDPDRLATVRMELAPLEAGLWREARDLLERALALAYPASAEVRPPRLAAASTVLEDLKRLLPDPESVERQVVDLWQIRIDLEARRPAR